MTLQRGETLSFEIELEDDGVPVVLDGTWGLACHIAAEPGFQTIDLEPTISGGIGIVSFDTINLPRSNYHVDIRFTDPSSLDTFSEVFELIIGTTVSPPSARP